MNYKRLKKYLIKDMRMSHVYQPIMIRNLIVNKGKADSEKIAKDLLAKFFTHAWFSHIFQFSYMDAGKILLGHQAWLHEVA